MMGKVPKGNKDTMNDTVNICMNRNCTVNILASATFCRRHLRAPKARARKGTRLFDAQGRVAVGQGLSRLARQDAKNRQVAVQS